MACPLFVPGSPLPLSDLFKGACSTHPDDVLSPEKLRTCCNVGHARSSCRTAANVQDDSIRLLVRSDDGQFIEVAWSTERNHHPVAVGTLFVARAAQAATTPLEHQARACATAYLRQNGKV